MKLPLINISFENWNDLGAYNFIFEIFEEGEYIHTSKQEIFEKVYLGQYFADNNGDVFKVIGKETPQIWRRVLPFFYKSKLIFEPTGLKMSVKEVTDILITRIKALEFSEDVIGESVRDMQTITTFNDLKELYAN